MISYFSRFERLGTREGDGAGSYIVGSDGGGWSFSLSSFFVYFPPFFLLSFVLPIRENEN